MSPFARTLSLFALPNPNATVPIRVDAQQHSTA